PEAQMAPSGPTLAPRSEARDNGADDWPSRYVPVSAAKSAKAPAVQCFMCAPPSTRTQTLHHAGRFPQHLPLGSAQAVQLARERGDPSTPPGTQQRLALGRRFDVGDPTVGRVRLTYDQSLGLEPIDQARHRWRTNLLGGRQLAQGHRSSAKHD